MNFCPHCGAGDSLDAGGRGHLVCRRCGMTVWQNPTPVALAVVRDESGAILLVRRGPGPGEGRWVLPGGFVEPWEDPAAAALRELLEETGIQGDGAGLLGVIGALSDNTLLIAYEVRATTIRTQAPSTEVVAVGYFRPDALPEMAFSAHRQIIADQVRR